MAPLFITVLAVMILLAHEIARHAIPVIIKLARRMPRTLADSQMWVRSKPIRSQLDHRFPSQFRFLQDRIDTHRFIGLPLTLMILAASYLIALFSGLTGEVLEAEGIVRLDNTINDLFVSWRVEPLISIFLWITALGSSPAITSAVIIATGFLWSQRRFHMMVPLWITSFGAVVTTSIGKFLIGRHRPESELDLTISSFSFPSGHSTAAIAVYGFLAFAIGRALPGMRARFEVAYWTLVLIGLVGLSRIVLGVHYVTDVAGGFLVGGFWLLIGLTIAEWTRPQTLTLQSGRNSPDSHPLIPRQTNQ